MRIRLSFKNVPKSAAFEELFNKKAEQLLHHLRDAEKGLLHLHGTLEKNPHREQYFSSISAYLPKMVFHARAKAVDLVSSVNAALDRISRQLEKERAKFKEKKHLKVKDSLIDE